MNQLHFEHWPPGIPKTLTFPDTTIYEHLLSTAKKHPEKIAINFYGKSYTYSEILQQVEYLAGYLEKELDVKTGDKVLLFMQNSPQFIISFYAILRVRAVVVPINPMNVTKDLEFYINDGNIKYAIVSNELYQKIAPLKNQTSLRSIIVTAYSEFGNKNDLDQYLPIELQTSSQEIANEINWTDILNLKITPSSYQGKIDDIAALPYTSGTTGLPKGCIHTNDTIQSNVIGAAVWNRLQSDATTLVTLPLFHVTGLVHSALAPIYAGSTLVIMTRWNRDYAAKLIEEYKCTHWINISTMLIDFLSNPNLKNYDISSLQSIGGGGAALPEAVGEQLFKLTGLKYMEGYGLTETISQTHFNPPHRPKMQCLGIPAFNVDARIINPETGELLGINEEGELIVNGPQVFKGYYNRDEENKKAFITIDGKRFFRTGDIVKMDEEGYFFIVDRLKRMINASGFKVWPTEVESVLYHHPAVQQACVVAAPDPRRGETVKAFIILKEEFNGKVSEAEIIEWSRERLAAYKVPRTVEFRTEFPTTASGKILWRKLQEDEWKKVANK